MIEVFHFWANSIGRIFAFVFEDLVIIENPRITFGTFILAFAVIGFALYFIFGTDFIPGLGNSANRGISRSINNSRKGNKQ